MAQARIHGGRWYYDRTGSPDRPPLLLLHGFTGCAGFWDEIVDCLCGTFSVIRVDLPGHGRTAISAAGGACRLEAVADQLAALLDHLGVERTHVWGYSMGGRLALGFALIHAARVQRLVLESASAGIADPAERAARRVRDEELASRIQREGIKSFVHRWIAQPLFATQAHLPDIKRKRALQLRLANTPAGLAASLRGMGTGAQPPFHDTLNTLAAPTLILAGADDAKYRAIGESMLQMIGDALMRIIPGAGHAPFWERPRQCIELVVPFLQGAPVPETFGQAKPQPRGRVRSHERTEYHGHRKMDQSRRLPGHSL